MLAPTGGDATYVAVAFEAPGGLSDYKSRACAEVAQSLLMGPRSSVPYSRAEAEDEAGVALSPFLHMHRHTGLLGLMAACAAKDTGKAIDAMSKRMQRLSKAASEATLKSAKAAVMAKHAAKMGSSRGIAQCIAQQLSIQGKFDANLMVGAASSITARDVAAYIEKALKGKPTFVTYGPLVSVPRYDALVARFG